MNYEIKINIEGISKNRLDELLADILAQISEDQNGQAWADNYEVLLNNENILTKENK